MSYVLARCGHTHGPMEHILGRDDCPMCLVRLCWRAGEHGATLVALLATLKDADVRTAAYLAAVRAIHDRGGWRRSERELDLDGDVALQAALVTASAARGGSAPSGFEMAGHRPTRDAEEVLEQFYLAPVEPLRCTCGLELERPAPGRGVTCSCGARHFGIVIYGAEEPWGDGLCPATSAAESAP